MTRHQPPKVMTGPRARAKGGLGTQVNESESEMRPYCAESVGHSDGRAYIMKELVSIHVSS